MTEFKLALDWTPNINHIGFFVAWQNGFYDEQNIAIKILDPKNDNYQTTPAKKVELGVADFALCPMESVISYRTKKNPFPLIAIAAIFKEDLSAIAVRSSAAIKSPKDLDGKTYASYQARYEDQIVKKMIQNDGGQGNINITYPNKLGIWETIINNSLDATWIFMNWEGVQAKAMGWDLQYFKMKDYSIPYSYSPVIVANENLIDPDAYRKFLLATKQGYLFAKDHPKEAIDMLAPFVPKKDTTIDLHKALSISAPYFGNSSDWGIMENENIKAFLNWIYTHKLESKVLHASELVTNTLLY